MKLSLGAGRRCCSFSQLQVLSMTGCGEFLALFNAEPALCTGPTLPPQTVGGGKEEVVRVIRFPSVLNQRSSERTLRNIEGAPFNKLAPHSAVPSSGQRAEEEAGSNNCVWL